VLKILKTFFVKTKTKTLFFVLEAPRDQEFGLQDYITASSPSLLSPPVPPIPFLPFPSHPFLPLVVGPLNPAVGSGGRCKLPSGVWGGAPAEIEFGAFYP